MKYYLVCNDFPNRKHAYNYMVNLSLSKNQLDANKAWCLQNLTFEQIGVLQTRARYYFYVSSKSYIQFLGIGCITTAKKENQNH